MNPLKNLVLKKDYYFNLQLFANPEDEGRTQEATERKKRKAREEGNVAKSQDLVSAVVFLISFWVLWIMAEFIFAMIKNFMLASFQNLDKPFSLNDAFNTVLKFSLSFWKIIGPVLIFGVVMAIILNVVQVGFMFTLKPITPKFNKISFTFEKLKEKVLFSKTVFHNLIFSLTKFLVLILFFVLIIKAEIPSLINLSSMDLTQSFGIIGNLVVKFFNGVGIFLVALGIPDFLLKKKQLADSLKMTRQEIKDEFKEDEGDPMIKGQLKEMYRNLLNRQTIRRVVPQADVVITNPTHFAVAIQYHLGMPAPMVLAKGEDDEALLIREIAQENDVPVVENPPLARQLYSITEVGDEIPEEFFEVVATVLVNLGVFQGTGV